MEKSRKDNKKNIIILSIILAILLFILGAICWENYQKSAEEAKTVKNLQIENEKKASEALDAGIDFAALQKINPDVYAYIKIEGTAVDYPILQSEDGSIDYLNTTLEGKEGYPGAIYTENVNSKDFHDANTVIYGHHMKDGSMFGSLLNYRDSNYMAEHPDITIYLPDEKLTYHIYAAVTFDDRYIMENYNFDTYSGRQDFINDLKIFGATTGVFNNDVEPGKDDSLITLSTCASGEEERFLVVGVKINENE